MLVHKPTETLIVGDLVFNIREPKGWQSTLVLTLAGAKGRLAQSRLWRTVIKDRRAAGR